MTAAVTTAATAPPGAPVVVPAAPHPAAVRRSGRAVVALLVLTLLTQRLAIPVGGEQVPVSLPLLLAVAAVALLTGALVLDPVQLRLYALAMAAVVACTLYLLARGRAPSLLSLGFLLSIYAIAVVRSPVDPRWTADRVHRAYLALMGTAAAVSVLQLLVQYLGVPYEDLLARVVPPAALLEGYRTGDPVAYGSELHRTNAVLFLEPSFLGYFLAVAVLVAVGRGARLWLVCLLIAGMIPTLSGNAVVVLVPGLVALALGRHRRHLVRLVPALVVGLVIAVLTPLGSLYLDRSTEVTAADTSSNLRLVQPYELLLPAWTESAETVWVGRGAGAATDVIEAQGAGLGAVITPAVPKLLVEYGLLGTVPVLFALLWTVLAGARRRPWAWGLLIGFVVLNPALLQVTLAVGTVLLMRLVPGLPDEPRSAPARLGGAPAGG